MAEENNPEEKKVPPSEAKTPEEDKLQSEVDSEMSEVEKAVYGDQDPSSNIERILDIKVMVHVNIGKLKMNLKEILDLMPGSIIEIPRKYDAPLALEVNNKKEVARGEVVTIGESVGIRVLTTSANNL